MSFACTVMEMREIIRTMLAGHEIEVRHDALDDCLFVLEIKLYNYTA